MGWGRRAAAARARPTPPPGVVGAVVAASSRRQGAVEAASSRRQGAGAVLHQEGPRQEPTQAEAEEAEAAEAEAEIRGRAEAAAEVAVIRGRVVAARPPPGRSQCRPAGPPQVPSPSLSPPSWLSQQSRPSWPQPSWSRPSLRPPFLPSPSWPSPPSAPSRPAPSRPPSWPGSDGVRRGPSRRPVPSTEGLDRHCVVHPCPPRLTFPRQRSGRRRRAGPGRRYELTSSRSVRTPHPVPPLRT